MNENTISYKLDRIKNATDRMRTKTGVVDGVIEDVATAVEGMSVINNQDKEITANGTYSAEEGYTGLGTINVNIPDGGYKGQLPNNSGISKIVNIGSELRVYLNVDALASGTRIYYKENNIPTLEDEYVDVPANSSYGIIPNVNINSMYGLRVAAYIEYTTGKKAFNNSKSLSSSSVKLTTTFNQAGAILLDIPAEEQGGTLNALCYSKYTNCAYMFINKHFYKLDLNQSAPSFVRIGEEHTFTSPVFLTTTDAGIFMSRTQMDSSSNLILYKEDTNEFIITNISKNYFVQELSNKNIVTTYCYDSYNYAKIFNKITNNFTDIFQNAKHVSRYGGYNIDTEAGIYIQVIDWNDSYKTVVLKYNQETNNYDEIGRFPAATSTASSWDWIMAVIPIIGTTLYKGYNEGKLYKLENNNFKKIDFSVATYYSIPAFVGMDIVQDLEDNNIIYAVSSDERQIYKINLNTLEMTPFYTSSSNMHRKITYYDKKVFASNCSESYGRQGYWDTKTNTWYSDGLYNRGVQEDFALYKVFNNKCYAFGDKVYKYTKTENDFTFETLGTINSSPNHPIGINTIQNGNKVYIYDSYLDYSSYNKVGIWVLDLLTDTLTQLTTTPYNRCIITNNKLYFLASKTNINQFIVDLTDDSYRLSAHLSGSNYFNHINIYNGVTTNANFTTSNMEYGVESVVSSFVDTTEKKITSFDKTLLDYSSSTKTYTMDSSISSTYDYITACTYLKDSDTTELIICFCGLPTEATTNE